MISRRLISILLLAASVACAGARSSSPAPVPAPVSAAPEAIPPILPTGGSWSFKYTPGPLSYEITRSAVIERVDSLDQKEITTNATHESLTLESTDQGIGFTIVVDSFSTTTQGLIGAVQATQLPVQLSGFLGGDSLTVNSQETNDRCNPVNSLLIADIHNLLIAFPATLSAGLTWTDSVNFQGCQSGIPTLLHTNRRYSVSGEVMFEGKPAVLVLRTDTSRSHGEGGLEQHRMTIDATGTGTAAYYLNPVTGRVSHISLNQILDLGVSTTAREYHFKQTSKQELRLVP